MNNIEIAKKLFSTGEYTCVLCKEEKCLKSTERGIRPLIRLIDEQINCEGFAAADKIVGKAAAMLYVILNISEVYATVISSSAQKIFDTFSIKYEYDESVEKIINRQGTGICPMEETVENIDDPQKAYDALVAKIKQLSQK